MTGEPKKALPEQAAGLPWHQSCGCMVFVTIVLVLIWFGGQIGGVLEALAGWIGRQ